MDIQQLGEKYQLSIDEIKVLRYMQKHKSELRQIGIRDLAKSTFTSASFIVKMSKKMKLSGYSELVFLMTDTINFITTDNDIVDISSLIKPFYNLINKHKDSMIMILASGYSQNIANYMSEYFNLHGFRCTANSHLELLRLEDHTDKLLIMISNSGETIRLNELLRQANNNEQDIIAFVGNGNSTMAEQSSLTISTGTFKPTSFESNIPQLFFGLSLIYFELLMSKTMELMNQK